MTNQPVETVQEKAQVVANERQADVFVYAGAVEEPFDFQFRRMVREKQRSKNAFLLVCTHGGSADAAYRIGRCLQRRYPEGKVIVHVDWLCKSAGTLLVLCADEVIMADRAELGPLDVQVWKPDEVAEKSSGLTPTDALTFLQVESFRLFENHFLELRFRSGLQVTTRTAADIASNLTVGLFKPIYEQLDPMRLGEYQRANMVAHHYGLRLIRKNAKEGTLEKLISGYPSHAFVIDRSEAAGMFNNIRPPAEYENDLANAVFDTMVGALGKDRPIIDCLATSEETEAESGTTHEHQKAKVDDEQQRARPTSDGAAPSGNGAGDEAAIADHNGRGSEQTTDSRAHPPTTAAVPSAG